MLAFAADLHLSDITWIKYPELRGDAYCSFRQIVTYCRKNGITALILGGDLFDKGNPDSQSIVEFISGVYELKKGGIDVFANQGQHDRATPPWTDVADNVIQLDGGNPVPVEITSMEGWPKVLGIDNTSPTRLKEILSTVEGPYDILVVHQALKGAVYGDNHNFEREWVPDFVKLVLMGDIHKPMDDGIFHYPGSISMRSTDESPQKSFLVIDDDLNVTRVPLVTRDFFKFTISDEEALDEAIKAMAEYDPGDKPQEIRKPMVIAKISPEVSDALSKLQTAATEHDMFLYPMDLRVVREEHEIEKVHVTTISMESLVDERLDAVDFEDDEERAATRDLVVRLLRSNAPSDELAVIKKDMGVIAEVDG